MLDADTRAYIAELESMGIQPWHQLSPADARKVAKQLAIPAADGPAMSRVLECDLVRADGGRIVLRELVPSRKPKSGAIVYFHGGGWVSGDIDEYEAFGRELAAATDATVLLVNYRKAPEFPHPIPVGDAWEAVRWAARRYQQEGAHSEPLVVAGDSAGGNLAAVVVQRAGKQGGPEIAMQVLIYPVLDCDMERVSYQDPDRQLDLLLSKKTMQYYWEHYLSAGGPRDTAAAFPLRERNLEGLPQTVVVSAEVDVLYSEAEEYAAKLAEAGVPVDHRQFEGQGHGFVTAGNSLPAAREAMRYIVAQINRVI